MSEAQEQKEKERGEWWVAPAGVIVYIILRDILGLWLPETVAGGIATWTVMLLLYKFTPDRRGGFGRWAVLSLFVTVYLVAALSGVPRYLCPRVGAVWTWGLIVTGLILSFRWVLILMHGGIEGSLWKWSAVSIGIGCLTAFFAYLNPEGFCK